MTDFEGNSAYAKYDTFNLGDLTENYRLKVAGYTGTAGNNRIHNGLGRYKEISGCAKTYSTLFLKLSNSYNRHSVAD